jgi:hypothetical protein
MTDSYISLGSELVFRLLAKKFYASLLSTAKTIRNVVLFNVVPKWFPTVLKFSCQSFYNKFSV